MQQSFNILKLKQLYDSGSKNRKLTHQNKWKKSVFQVYKEASLNPAWTNELKKECKKYKIDFFSAPYDLDYVDQLNKHMQAYKIGSGDISWHEIIERIAKKKKPVFLATGASEINEVKKALNILYKKNKKICLMQCNTNYPKKIILIFKYKRA